MRFIETDSEMARMLCPELMLAGPFTSVEFRDTYIRPSEPEKVAISFMREWTDHEVVGLKIDRTRRWWNVLYPIEVGSDGQLQLNMAISDGLDYGHFAATSTDGGFVRCFSDYLARLTEIRQGDALTHEQFERCCRHRMPANAILCVTADNLMLWVRRKPDVFLHPGYLHPLGITLNVDDDTAEAGLYRCLKQEAGIEPLDVEAGSIIWVGVSDNEPQHQPILLGIVRLLLTADEVTERLPQAIRPDGRGVFYAYKQETFDELLRGDERVTPSGKVFAYLMREGLLQGILPRW